MAKKHAHKYRRITVAGERVWGCALPDCTHYMPKHMEENVVGKRAICWNCEQTFIFDYEAMKDDMPRCPDCRDGISKEAKGILDFLKEKEKETA